MGWQVDPGSFKDPSGFVFVEDGVVFRQINETFGPQFRQFIESGLYEELQRDHLLVAHEEVDLRPDGAQPAFAVIKPARVPFISYPYEWCFGQLKAAALLTLEIQRRALERGLTLRDASAYNVQFIGTRPIFIDTLSFGPYAEGQPWLPYRQFCEHFLAPLALMAHVDPSLGQMTRLHPNGVPLRLATRLLPLRTRLRPGLMVHLHLHQRSAMEGPAQHRDRPGPITSRGMSRTAMLGLIDGLLRTVSSLSIRHLETLWSTYTDNTSYSESAQLEKERLLREWIPGLGLADGGAIWDLGANTGHYSRIAAETCPVVSFDLDHAAVEQNFRRSAAAGSAILPLVQDLMNPSGGAGWHTAERRSLEDRGPADLVLALALVHHLAITGNVPLPHIARFLGGIASRLIVEFVPQEDSQVQRMLALRENVFPGYAQPQFEEAFARHFEILQAVRIAGTVRTMYLMKRPA